MKLIRKLTQVLTLGVLLSLLATSLVFASDGSETGTLKGYPDLRRVYGELDGEEWFSRIGRGGLAGTLELELSDGTRAPVFCTDIHHPTAKNDRFVASDAEMDCQVKWLLTHYPAILKGDSGWDADEMAARQMAVWHFSDGLLPDADTVIGARAWEIIDTVPNEASCVADAPRVAITPASVVNLIGEAQTFTVTVAQGEDPLADVDVALSTGDILTTDANGEATFTLSSDNVTTINIEAAATLPLPVGTIFEGVDPNRQKLVLGEFSEGLVLGQAQATWQGEGSIIVTSFNDHNMNGVRDQGEPFLSSRQIVLYQDETPVAGPRDTNENGQVTFEGLYGDYTVRQYEKNGWYATTSLLQDVTVDNDVLTVYFGQIKTPVIVGQKFEDVNRDGVWDEDEAPLSGWELQLFRENGSAVIGMKGKTNADGEIVFSSDRDPSDMLPGTYYVQETLLDDQLWMATTGISQTVTVEADDVVNVPIGNAQLVASVSLSKSGPAQAYEGDDVTYDFTIVNDGEIALEDITLTDPLLGGEIVECATAELEIGEVVSCQANYEVPLGADDPVINTATVVGSYGEEDEIACEFGDECFQYEFLGAITNDDGSVTLRFELTNECGNATALSNVAFGLPDGVVPLDPEDGDTYTSPNGNDYEVESPTNNPFYSIKFETDADDGIRDGASDIFEYTLPAGTYDPSQEIQIQAKGGQTVEVVAFTPESCVSLGMGGSVVDSDTHSLDVLYPPVAEDDSAETDEDVAVDIDVLANDSDPDGDELTITTTTDPANGSVEINDDGAVAYTPDAGFVGEDTFTYIVSDGEATATATVMVTVNSVNAPPVAEDDTAYGNQDEAITIAVLENDSDPDGDELSIVETSDPTHGSVEINDDGTITYTPDAGFIGEDTFTYIVSDGEATDTATVTVNVADAAMICAAHSDNFNANDVDPRWTSLDINGQGSGDPLGSTFVSDGLLTVSSDGREIWNGQDDLRFVYQQIPDDFYAEIEVYSTTLSAAQWSKGGLMVRSGLESGADLVMINYAPQGSDPDNGSPVVQFAYRVGGSATRVVNDIAVADGLPVWLRLEREGDLYFFAYSTDGIAWNEIGWVDIDLGDDPYVGLSVASYEESTEQAMAFDSFTLCQYDYPDPPAPPPVEDEPTITTTQMITSEICGAADIALSVAGQGEITTYHRPVDLMIVLDKSGSMDDAGQNPDQPLQEAKDAAEILIDQLDPAYDRVGLVSYAHDANFDYPLSTRYNAVKGAIDNLDANGYTNIGDAIYDAREALVTYGRDDAVPVIVVLSDGVANRSHAGDTCEMEPITDTICTEDAVAQAAAAKDLDITVYAIGLNLGGIGDEATEQIARATLEAMASASAYHEAPDSSDLAGIYEEIAEDVVNVAAYDTRIIASLPVGVDYIAGSASLEPSTIVTSENNTTLTWNVGIVPISKTRTVSFSVEVELAGESTLLEAYPETRVEYRDVQDELRQMDFPNAEMTIEIVPCNLPPVAEDDTAETNENTAVEIAVLDNDSDPEGDELTITETSDPANGNVEINADGAITYTPDAGFSGEDSFEYTISDGELTDTATVTITVIDIESVRPILECVVDNRDGSYTAYFGYLNGNDFPVPIGVGDRNKFTPTPQDRGQPTTFEPGRTSYWPDAAFGVDFDGNNLVWTLDGRTATASRNSTPCSNHIFFEKEWQNENGDLLAELPAGLPDDFSIAAESELGTALCSYPEDGTELVCEYDNNAPALDDNGLWVPVGSVYTVTETGLPDRWAADDGVGAFTVGDGYCEAGLEGMSKYCEHTVINVYIPNQPPVAEDDSAETDEDTPVT
ncbi:MAG: Ig-like domain-containing protein, partial [Anaerolineales bacterium]